MNGNDSVSHEFPTSWPYAQKGGTHLSSLPTQTMSQFAEGMLQNNPVVNEIHLTLHIEPWQPHCPRTCYRQGLWCQTQIRVFPTRGRMNNNKIECYTGNLKAKVMARKKAERCPNPIQSHGGSEIVHC